MLALGTKRGLFLVTSKGQVHWDVQATTLQRRRVYNVIVDQRGHCRLFAAENGDFFGTFVRYSDDCGIYKSVDAGEEWQDIQQNLPSEFGFPITLDRHHTGTLYVIVEDPVGRHNIGSQLTVYRTTNDEASWEPLTQGLPGGAQVKLGVLRHGMCTDNKNPCGVYVGTNTGQLFASGNGGESWELITDFLPSIYSVTATILEEA